MTRQQDDQRNRAPEVNLNHWAYRDLDSVCLWAAVTVLQY